MTNKPSFVQMLTTALFDDDMGQRVASSRELGRLIHEENAGQATLLAGGVVDGKLTVEVENTYGTAVHKLGEVPEQYRGATVQPFTFESSK